MILPCAKPELYEYSPHQRSMLLIDRVVSYNLEDMEITVEVDVTSEALFFHPEFQGIPGWISFEYMAQAIAILSGIAAKSKGEVPRIGFILGLREFETFQPSTLAGECLRVMVKGVFREAPVAVFEGQAQDSRGMISKGVINTIEADEQVLAKMQTGEL